MGNSSSGTASNGSPMTITETLPSSNILTGFGSATSGWDDSVSVMNMGNTGGGTWSSSWENGVLKETYSPPITVVSPQITGPKNATNIPNAYANQYANQPARPPTKLYRNRFYATSPFRPYQQANT